MSSGRSISRLSRVDWDFSGSFSESPFSWIHWHPARYASQLPSTIIGVLTRPGDLIVDPFVGSGTTLVEAQRLGRNSIGIDLHPLSCQIARAKTIDSPARQINGTINAIKHAARVLLDRQLRFESKPVAVGKVPPTVQGRKWYTPRVLNDLASLWTLKSNWRGRKRLIADVAFSAILLNVCRETRHWGYVCDNTEPIGSHSEDVLPQFTAVLSRLAKAYESRDAEMTRAKARLDVIASADVREGDAATVMASLPDRSVDLVLTSPPYFGVCDYIKAQRLTLEWCGIDIEALRQKEIGARSKRHRRVALQEYVIEMAQVLSQARRCLKNDGKCVLVIGQSAARTAVLGSIKAVLSDVGFCLEMDSNRRVSSQRRLAPSIRGEHILVMSR